MREHLYVLEGKACGRWLVQRDPHGRVRAWATKNEALAYLDRSCPPYRVRVQRYVRETRVGKLEGR